MNTSTHRGWLAPAKRWAQRLIIGSAVVALASCAFAVRTGYNQGPMLAYWWLDGYIGFTPEQGPRARAALADWFAWHRTQELPRYAELLKAAREEVLQDATPERLCRWADVLGERFEPLMAQALPRLAPLAVGLNSEQLQRLQGRYDEANRDFQRKHLAPGAEKRLQASTQRAIENAERLYGRLAAPQRAVVAEVVRAAPFDAEAWDRERRLRQGEVLQTLTRLSAEGADAGKALQALQALGQRMQTRAGTDGAATQQRLTQLNCERAARIHNSTTPAQRQRASAWLKGWEDDARALAAEP